MNSITGYVRYWSTSSHYTLLAYTWQNGAAKKRVGIPTYRMYCIEPTTLMNYCRATALITSSSRRYTRQKETEQARPRNSATKPLRLVMGREMKGQSLVGTLPGRSTALI